MSTYVSPRKLSFVDASVSSGTSGAAAGSLTFMVGGTKRDFKRALPVLKFIGKKILLLARRIQEVCKSTYLGAHMNQKKNLRVFIFEDDKNISFLLKMMIDGFGYDVSVFPDPTACPVYREPTCSCSMDSPCADILITDFNMPNMSGVELLKLQRDRGCKTQIENKAVMSAAITPQQREDIEQLGYHFIEKPYRNTEIKKWLEECSGRIHRASAYKDDQL